MRKSGLKGGPWNSLLGPLWVAVEACTICTTTKACVQNKDHDHHQIKLHPLQMPYNSRRLPICPKGVGTPKLGSTQNMSHYELLPPAQLWPGHENQ